MSAHEEENRLRKSFSKYDKDGSGSIDRKELEQALKAARLPTNHADEILAEADLDHNGEISYKEFKLYVTKKEALLKSTFEQFDKSKTGFITKEVRVRGR